MTLVLAASPAIPGLQFWVVVWYVILALGVMGLVGALPWGRMGEWQGREEVLRGIGTVSISLGMLFLLHGVSSRLGQVLLVTAIASFLLALRHRRPRRTVLRLAQDHLAVPPETAATSRFP